MSGLNYTCVPRYHSSITIRFGDAACGENEKKDDQSSFKNTTRLRSLSLILTPFVPPSTLIVRYLHNFMPAKKKATFESATKKNSQPSMANPTPPNKIKKADGASNPDSTTSPPKKRKRRDDPTKTIPPLFSPEVRARLAIDLLRIEQAPGIPPSGTHIFASEDLLERSLVDKLRQANTLLNAAAGLSKETVHAYQLFKEDTSPISFREISRRFAEAKWPKLSSHNTIESHVKKLLNLAHTEIQIKQEYYQQRLSASMGYPATLQNLEDKIEFGLNNLIRDLGLTNFLSRPAEAVGNAAKYLMKLMGEGLAEAKTSTSEELHEAMLGYYTFLSYVCNNLSYEKFLSDDHHHVYMDLEDLASVVYFFENLSAFNLTNTSIGHRIGMLAELVKRANRIPPEIADELIQIREKLASEGRVKDSWQNQINLIAVALKAAYVNWQLETSIQYSSYAKVEKALGTFYTNAQKVNASIEANNIILLSEKLRNLPSRDSLYISILTRPEGLRQDLQEIISLAAEVRNSIKTLPPIRESKGLIDLLGEMHDMLRNGLVASPESDLEKVAAKLQKLFKRLTPYSGSRLVRPYELFLFAAQNGHLVKELTISRSKLSADTFPNPPHKLSLSILWAHSGARFDEENEFGPKDEHP